MAWRLRAGARSYKDKDHGCAGSSQPTLAALVALDVLEALTLATTYAQVELLHVFVGAQVFGFAVHHDAATLHDVAVVGVLERHIGVLLGDQEGDLFLLVEVLDDVE